MRRVGFFAFTVGLLAVLSCSVGRAQDDAEKYWPQWRGPLATGVAPLGDPPTTWSETENVKWKVACPGGGGATPIIWGDKIFVLAAAPAEAAGQANAADGRVPLTLVGGRGGMMGGGARGGARGGGNASSGPWKFLVLCLDRETGKVLWEKTAREAVPHENHHNTSGFACYSPVTDGEYLYAYFGSWGIYCYDFAGNQKWDRDLGEMRIVAQFGEGGSPAICDDKIIVQRDQEGQSRIVALNKATGDVLWSKDRDEGTSWSTPLIVEVDGKKQIVTTATNKVRAYDPENGEVIWECGGMTRNVIPTALPGFGNVYAISGFMGAACLAIELGHTGDLTGTDAIKWQANRATPYVPSGMLYEDKIYFLGNNDPVLSCYQAETGKAFYAQQRISGLGTIYSSISGAGGKVYIIDRSGKCVVLKHGEEYEILATNSLNDTFNATPVIAGKELYLRGEQSLYCLVED